MIIVAGWMEVEADGADAAEALARTMMAETRKEDGCVIYDITRSLEHPGRFHVYEEWQSLPALEAHFATPHMATFRAGLGALNVTGRSVARREGGEPTTL
ncbi:MAG: putative quinol monooxygenase [Pseudomonadota bacterium]